MRSALALLALLLLLQPPASLSLVTPTTPVTSSPSGNAGRPSHTSTNSNKSSTSGGTMVTSNTVKQSESIASSDRLGTSAVVRGSTSAAPRSSGVTSTLAQQKTMTTPSVTDGKLTTDNSITTTSDPKTTLTPASTPAKPETTSSQKGTKDTTGPGAPSSHDVTTKAESVSLKGESQVTSKPSTLSTVLHTTSALPSLTVLTSTHQLTTGSVTTKRAESSSEEPDKSTAASSSAGTTAGPTFTSQGITTTLTTESLTTDPQTSSKMPAVPETSSSVPETSSSVPETSSSIPETSATKALQTTASSLRPTATSPVRGPTSSSSQMASTASTGFTFPSFVPVPRDNRVQCRSDEKLNDKMLILNLTKTSLCGESPSDDRLITILCRAAKATYNSTQDECIIYLIHIPETQAVAIKNITIHTHLLPKDLYLPLKDKWNDLQEAGVSYMKFGHQGPPEETEDRFSMPLIITIVCMASFLLLVAALYGCCHQRLSQRKDQQRLTEELQTVENGYHDNPTLEVMETSSEMQEKKVVNLNGELGDSWIVPLDNLTKDDLDEEEDTHL
ncbi:podocalyxin [Diceros bicornis minor]|uniref:podocalyxin n=1 Tax=Diceros bicornis minor TaxID=77932 RepID=UPI0026F342E3|nr:podocalyxin [Diceros bicornis minor]